MLTAGKKAIIQYAVLEATRQAILNGYKFSWARRPMRRVLHPDNTKFNLKPETFPLEQLCQETFPPECLPQ